MAFGSLVNMTSVGGGKDVKPEVGMGATYLGWTDREPYTVIAISKSGKTITVQEDIAIRVDNNGMSESQKYEFKPNPLGRTYNLRLTKKGWSCRGMQFALGYRSKYYDFSF